MKTMGISETSTAPHSMRVRRRVPSTRLRWSAYSFRTFRTSSTSTTTNNRKATNDRPVKTIVSSVVMGFRKLLKAFIAMNAHSSTNSTEPRTITTIFLRLVLVAMDAPLRQ